MGEMADFALDSLHSEDEHQLNILGHSNVFYGIGRGQRPTECPHCKSPLVTRNGRNGQFLCCPKWPSCKGITWTLTLPDNSHEIAEATGEW